MISFIPYIGYILILVVSEDIEEVTYHKWRKAVPFSSWFLRLTSLAGGKFDRTTTKIGDTAGFLEGDC